MRWAKQWWYWQDWWEEEEPKDDWVREPRASHEYTLIWLHACHGRPGKVGAFIEDLQAKPSLRKLLRHVRIVAPCAPRRPSWFDDWGSFQWFVYRTDLLRKPQQWRGHFRKWRQRSQVGRNSSWEGAAHQDWQQDDDTDWPQDKADLQQLLGQRERLRDLLVKELDLLPEDDGRRIVLAGVSQGASMALDVLLHSPRRVVDRIAGVLCVRGMLQKESRIAAQLPGVPLLATHGDDDQLVPIQAALKSYDFVRRCGASLRFCTYKGLNHHSHSEEESEEVAEFIRGLLKAPTPPKRTWPLTSDQQTSCREEALAPRHQTA